MPLLRSKQPKGSIEGLKVLELVSHWGVLPVTHSDAPSLVSAVTGEVIKGSWWSHPKSHEVQRVWREMEERPDVLITKLLSGRNTLVHQRFWPALYAIGTSEREWQLRGLTPLSMQLLEEVRAAGSVRTSDLSLMGADSPGQLGAAARRLEVRLLAHGRDVHTDGGSHTKQLETWTHAMKERGFKHKLVTVEEGRDDLERATHRFNRECGVALLLPWQGKATR